MKMFGLSVLVALAASVSGCNTCLTCCLGGPTNGSDFAAPAEALPEIGPQ
jgi:hypothetical protein